MSPEDRLQLLESRTRRLLTAVTTLGLLSAWLFATHPTSFGLVHAESKEQSEETMSPPIAPENALEKTSAEPITDVLRTRRVEIINLSGQVVASLGTGITDGGKLIIGDPKGEARVVLTMAYDQQSQKHGGFVTTIDDQNHISTEMGVTMSDGLGRIVVHSSENDEEHTVINCKGIKTQHVLLDHPNGRPAVRMGTGEFVMMNSMGKVVLKAGVDKDYQNGGLVLCNENGEALSYLGAGRGNGQEKRPSGALILNNSDIKEYFKVIAGDTGSRLRGLLLRDRNTEASVNLLIHDGQPGVIITNALGQQVSTLP